MPYTAPKAYYATTLLGTYTEITGIQSINIRRGRQHAQDPFSGSSCVIELIPATTYATPFAVGQFLDVRDSNSGSSAAYYQGVITDVQRRYDIPYNSVSGAAPADRVVLTVTGGTGVMGSSLYTQAQTRIAGDVMYEVQLDTNQVEVIQPTVSIADFYNPSGVQQSSTAFGGGVAAGTSVLAYKSVQLATAQWIIDDGDNERNSASDTGVNVYPTNGWGTPISFVDDGSTGTEVFKYSAIEYLSGAQTTFSRVVVKPDGLTPQSAQSATNAKNALVVETYDDTTTQADKLADYLLLINSQTTPVPFIIQTSTAVSDTAAKLGKMENYPVGVGVTVKFRGSTVYATVQGWSFGYYPDLCTVQCYLSPSLGTPFTLDSSTFGVLDTNRLGYP